MIRRGSFSSVQGCDKREDEEELEEEGVISPALEGVTASVSVVWRGEKMYPLRIWRY